MKRFKIKKRIFTCTFLIIVLVLTAAAAGGCSSDSESTAGDEAETLVASFNSSNMPIGDAATALCESGIAAFSHIDAAEEESLKADDPYADIDEKKDPEAAVDGDIVGESTAAVAAEDTAMIIMDKAVSKEYLRYRAALYAARKYEDPVKAAERLITKQVTEWSFAEENGLLPTQNSIDAYCSTLESDAHSDIESREYMLIIIQNLGLSEAEYFKALQMNYEIPFILVSKNISSYCEENKKEYPKYASAEISITDEKFVSELREELKASSDSKK